MTEGGREKQEKWTRVIQQGERVCMLGGERERKVREDKWMEGEMDIGKRGVVKQRCDVGVDDGLKEKEIEG